MLLIISVEINNMIYNSSRISKQSSLSKSEQRASNEGIFKEPIERVGITDIRPYLVGDSAFPTSPWLVKPYPEATGDPD